MNHEDEASRVEGASTATDRYKRFLRATLFSLVPGLGQLRFGLCLSGSIFLIIFFLITVGICVLRAPNTLGGLLLVAWASILVYLISSVHLFRRTLYEQFGKRWLLGFVGMSLTISFLYLNMATRVAGYRPYTQVSESMEPGIMKNDVFMVDLQYFVKRKPKPGNIVVFQLGNHYLLKRVIAEEGQSVKGIGKDVYINSLKISEPYAVHSGPCCDDGGFSELQVPKDHYFLLGDNRDLSWDSRRPEFGFIPRSAIFGRPLYVIRNGFNLNRQGQVIR